MSDPRYWFRAKRYGWGWGLPATWQGWAFLILWLLVLVVGSRSIAPMSREGFWLFFALMVAALVGVCYKKGEPPRWRWGE